MTPDEVITLALDARDAVHKARRAASVLKWFNPKLLQTLHEIEDSVTVAINDQLVLRRSADVARKEAA